MPAQSTNILNETWQQTWDTVLVVWNYEIATFDGNPLTIGKIFVAIFLFAAGLLITRFITAKLKIHVYDKYIESEHGQSVLQTVSHYILIIFFALLALKAANIPLTIFTLLGGAIAIGIGFGSQNLINNFISGLILLAEKPINIGDMIEVEGTYGRVIRVGARCTNVRTFTNIDILVPNSTFLEKNVINWTLTDDRVRTLISVGVAYGSPVAKVMELIKQAVEEEKKVLNFPEPVVIFNNFGDSALEFDVHFWIRMRTMMDRRLIESNIRCHIDRLFNESGIVIAFPQRDIHLDVREPLPVVVKTQSQN